MGIIRETTRFRIFRNSSSLWTQIRRNEVSKQTRDLPFKKSPNFCLDARIERDTKANQNDTKVKDHENEDGMPTGVKGTRKTVTDPTTGKEVQIEDVNADFMKAADDPVVWDPD